MSKEKSCLNICMLTTSYPRFKGDYYLIFAHELFKRLAKKHNITVVTPHDITTKDCEVMEGVNIHRFSYFFPKSQHKLAYRSGMAENVETGIRAKIQVPLFILSMFIKGLKYSKKKDILCGHVVLSGIAGVILAKIRKKPFVLFIHRNLKSSPIIQAIYKWVLEKSDFVVFNSNYTKDIVMEFADIKNYEVINPSADLKRFNIDVKKTDLKKKYDISKDSKIIFALGRLVEKKGFEYLIRAMPKIMEKTDSVLLIGGDGKLRNKLKTLAENLGIQDHVKFTGMISSEKVPSYLRSVDLFVLPSILDSKGETETLGLVLIEAMACGCPVIGSNIGGIGDVIDHNINGFLSKPKDYDDISAKAITLLTDENLKEKFIINGMKKAENKFNWDNIAAKTDKVLHSLLR